MLLKSFSCLSLLAASSVVLALPDLPEPVSNNAVASTSIRDKTYVLSVGGLALGKNTADQHNKVWLHTVGEFSWSSLPTLPSQQRLAGRIGISAVALNNNFFIFGGAFVHPDGGVTTASDSYRLDPVTRRFTRLNDMPVPVDHAAAVAHQNRYVYLVSGWSDHGAVNLVQVFDNFTQRWAQATPFPGAPVFGHAATIVANQLVVCDGVTLHYTKDQAPALQKSPACWAGILGSDPLKISWRQLPHPDQQGRYRLAASTVRLAGEEYAAFIGGSSTPYALNGVGYQGEAAEPSSAVWLYSPQQQRWFKGETKTAVMDLRTLVEINGNFYSLGGMLDQQQVTNQVINQQIKLLPE
jgi:N-acetylneuraminic acid mutarotase